MRPGPETESPPGARQPPKDVVVGRIVRPHGVRGEVILDLSADLLALVGEGTAVQLGDERRARRLVGLRRHGKMHRVSFRGVTTRTQAEGLRGLPVRLRLQGAAALPPNVYYHWQILGLEVETETGEALGRISEILETGANDVYVVRNPAGEELLLPAIDDVIRSIDLSQARIVVRLLPGLRDETGPGVA